jgi:hypothetical protein
MMKVMGEMIKGARTYAEPHPFVEPDVTAKMNRMTATKDATISKIYVV